MGHRLEAYCPPDQADLVIKFLNPLELMLK